MAQAHTDSKGQVIATPKPMTNSSVPGSVVGVL